MRELLTVLAGLVLLVLVAALAVPGFVDWGQHRAEIERRLSDAVGIEVVTTGPISLAVLPSPRIVIDGVRLGDADPAGSRAVVGRLSAELALGPLLRGEARLTEVLLDRADLTLAVQSGMVALPRRWERAVLPTSVAKVELTRSRLMLVRPDASAIATVSMALAATMPGPGGPLRIEGEVAGRSVRITTGDADAAGAVRAKAIVTGPGLRQEFDGTIQLAGANGRLMPKAAGRLAVAMMAGEDGQPAASLTAQVEASRDAIRLSALVLEVPGAGRADGEGQWLSPIETGSVPMLTMRARRLDAGAALERWAMIREALEREGWPSAAGPHAALRVDLSSEQVAYRGEEATGAAIRAVLRAAGRPVVETAALAFAGVNLTVAPAASSSAPVTATLQAPDLRRLALALQRLGVETGLAEDLASLRDLALVAELPDADWPLATTPPVGWRAQGHFGRAEAVLRQSAEGAVMDLTLAGVDLLALARPARALARLAAMAGLGNNTLLQIRSDSARLGDSPAGSLRLVARLGEQGAELRRLQLNGFDGVTVAFDEPPQGSGASLISLSAARADAIGQLVARLTGDPALARALIALKGLAPVRLDGSLTMPVKGRGHDLALSGRVGAMGAAVRLASGGDGSLTALSITLEAERAVLFRTLGLPPPGAGREATRLSLTRHGGGGQATLRLDLAGPDGLVLAAPGLQVDEAGVWHTPFAVSAPRPAAVLPDFVAPTHDGRPLQAEGVLIIRSDGIALDRLSARLGGDEVRGALVWRPEGAASGALTLPAIDLARLVREVIGPGPVVEGETGSGVWSGTRFAMASKGPALPELDLAVTSPAIDLGEAGRWHGRLRLSHAAGLVRLSDVTIQRDGFRVTGTASLERQGSQVALRATGSIGGLPLAELTSGAMSGEAQLDLQLGASGESPARLAASLSGTVEARLTDTVIPRFAPDALERIAAAALTDTVLEDSAQLAATVRRQVESGTWAFGTQVASGIMSGGQLRFAPISVQREGRKASVAIIQDIRNRSAEIRATMVLDQPPRGWMGPTPQLTVTSRGPWRQPTRAYDVSALANALSQKALQREINRVEAMEADIRERALFNRRLRRDRETDRREAEQRAAEERAARERAAQEKAAQEKAAQEKAALEKAARERALPQPVQREPAADSGVEAAGASAGTRVLAPPQGLAPPLPPALVVPSVPAPLSRPSLN